MFRKITVNNGKAVESIFEEMKLNINNMKKIENLQILSEILNKHVDELEKATRYLITQINNGNLASVSASGTPYLKMFGQVFGGHYMGKAAIFATNKFKEDNDEFYKNKITLSKYYIEQLLPLSSSYIPSIFLGNENLYSINSSRF